MEKKLKENVAIVTIISNNYGNRLQNYALQETLKKLDAHVETIPIRIKYDIKGKIKLWIKTVASGFKKKYSDVCWGIFDQNIKWSKYTIESSNISEHYNYFIAGSDQIWNPLFECNSDREFLTFTANEKKFAYAASIGLDELPINEMNRYRKYISSFKNVSVREKTAADIIENLGCARPKVVLDPTMLLNEEDWKKIVNQSELRIKGRYVVAYFLGIRTAEYDAYITQKSIEMKADLIDIAQLPQDQKRKIGPAEFVSLLYYSEAVFTDSFHGTVFSILFHKPFIVFERPYEDGYGKMSSRLDTLLETFELEKHRVSCMEQLSKIQMDCDSSKVNEILEKRKKDSVNFLREALNRQE